MVMWESLSASKLASIVRELSPTRRNWLVGRNNFVAFDCKGPPTVGWRSDQHGPAAYTVNTMVLGPTTNGSYLLVKRFTPGPSSKTYGYEVKSDGTLHFASAESGADGLKVVARFVLDATDFGRKPLVAFGFGCDERWLLTALHETGSLRLNTGKACKDSLRNYNGGRTIGISYKGSVHTIKLVNYAFVLLRMHKALPHHNFKLRHLRAYLDELPDGMSDNPNAQDALDENEEDERSKDLQDLAWARRKGATIELAANNLSTLYVVIQLAVRVQDRGLAKDPRLRKCMADVPDTIIVGAGLQHSCQKVLRNSKDNGKDKRDRSPSDVKTRPLSAAVQSRLWRALSGEEALQALGTLLKDDQDESELTDDVKAGWKQLLEKAAKVQKRWLAK